MPDAALFTVDGLMAAIYDYCGNPTEDKLAPSMVLTALFDRIQHYKNELDITNEGWRLEPYVLHVQPNREEYTIEDGSFGRPFFAETYDPNNVNLRRREVKVVRLQDREMFSETVEEITGTVKYSARVMAFRNIGQPAPTVHVFPLPKQAATYRIWHESIITDELFYGQTVNFLKQFFPLLKVDTCMDVLPFCGWPNEVMMAIMNQRMAAKQQYYETFYAYIQEAFHSQVTPMRASNSSRRGQYLSY